MGFEGDRRKSKRMSRRLARWGFKGIEGKVNVCPGDWHAGVLKVSKEK